MPLQLLRRSAPSRRCDFGDLPVGHVWQAGEDILEIRVRVESTPAAAFDDGVNDGTAFTSIGIADKEPVLLADGGGPDGILDKVMPCRISCRAAELDRFLRRFPVIGSRCVRHNHGLDPANSAAGIVRCS
jgi:hypothetical protein